MIIKNIFKRFLKPIIKTTVMSHFVRYRLARSHKGRILLTFDDGPDNETTPVILDLLSFYNAKAVFFLIGEKAKENPALCNRILNDGHVLGNHSFFHTCVNTVTFCNQFKDIMMCQDIIEKITKYKPYLFRPPTGIISPENLFAAWRLRLKPILWTIEGGECGVRKQWAKEDILEYLKKRITTRQIVLFHDNNKKVPYILENLLPFANELNLQFDKPDLIS